MIKLYLFLLLSLFGSACIAQSFEGSLKYNVEIDVLGDSLINGAEKRSVILNDINIPRGSIYYYYSSKGDYVSVFKKENDNIIQVFRKSDNLLYTLEANSIVVAAIDVTIDLEKKMGYPPTIKVLPDKYQFNGLECSAVKVFWRAGTYTYYFKKDFLTVNPENYNGFEYDQWYNFLLISNSLPIRIEKEVNNFYRLIFSLENVIEEEFDASLLELPKMKENKELGKIYPNRKIFLVEE